MLYCTILILLIPVSWNLLNCDTNHKNRNKFMYIVGFCMVLIGSLRSFMTFNDTDSYVLHFSYVNDLGNFWDVPDDRFEYGYMIYEKFIHKYISHSYTALLSVQSIIVVSTALFFISKKSISFWIPIFLFVGLRIFFFELQAERQGIAMGFSYLAFYYVGKDKLKSQIFALILIILAFSFHSSAIVSLLVFPLIKFESTLRNVFIVLLACLMMSFFWSYLLAVVGKSESIYLEDSGFRLGDILNVLISVFIIIYCSKSKNYYLSNDSVLYWCVILSLIYSVVSLYLPIATRLGVYFRLPSYILLANSISIRKMHKLPTYESIILLTLFLFYIYCLLYKPEWNRAYPYYFFWEDTTEPYLIN